MSLFWNGGTLGCGFGEAPVRNGEATVTTAKVTTANSLVGGAPLKEIALIALATLAVFLLLALWSYSPSDPAWSYQGTGLETTNLVGSSGAWSADVLLSLFGALAYLLPPACVIGGWR
ncbi:MAG: hypothetical protein E2O75_09225, partial [Chloroflexi bacterium]